VCRPRSAPASWSGLALPALGLVGGLVGGLVEGLGFTSTGRSRKRRASSSLKWYFEASLAIISSTCFMVGIEDLNVEVEHKEYRERGRFQFFDSKLKREKRPLRRNGTIS